jgi:hypothetical protein
MRLANAEALFSEFTPNYLFLNNPTHAMEEHTLGVGGYRQNSSVAWRSLTTGGEL